ncbi:hypothetical protein [Ruegeria sp.]
MLHTPDISRVSDTLWPGTVAEFQKRMAQSGLEQYAPVPAAGSEV